MQNAPRENFSKGKYVSQEVLAEVKNALQIISGFAQLQLLKAKPDMIPNTKRQLEEIVHQVERIDRLLPQAAFKREKK